MSILEEDEDKTVTNPTLGATDIAIGHKENGHHGHRHQPHHGHHYGYHYSCSPNNLGPYQETTL